MENPEINIEADFYTFRNQIVNRFGKHFFDQADIFFERAVAQANQGNIYSAIADGKFAIELSNYSSGKLGIPFLIGFTAQLYSDVGQIRKAKSLYELGLNFLTLMTRST